MSIQRKEGLKDNKKHQFIAFYDNPIENIPLELLTEGEEIISNYFENL